MDREARAPRPAATTYLSPSSVRGRSITAGEQRWSPAQLRHSCAIAAEAYVERSAAGRLTLRQSTTGGVAESGRMRLP